MRPFLFSLACALVVGVAWAQSPSGNGNMPQISTGQTYKDLQLPVYQNGHLSYMVSAVSAKGLTINRAETTDLKIEIYTGDKVTTTITSPKADVYLTDHKMRTKDTVQIDRADMVATAQTCDFDLTTKKYLLREKVKVVLKNFDAGLTRKPTVGGKPTAESVAPMPEPAPVPAPSSVDDVSMPINPHTLSSGESTIDFPGASANTNTAPAPSSTPANP